MVREKGRLRIPEGVRIRRTFGGMAQRQGWLLRWMRGESQAIGETHVKSSTTGDNWKKSCYPIQIDGQGNPVAELLFGKEEVAGSIPALGSTDLTDTTTKRAWAGPKVALGDKTRCQTRRSAGCTRKGPPPRVVNSCRTFQQVAAGS